MNNIQVQKEKEIRSSLAHVLHKTYNLAFSRRSRAVTAKKYTNIHEQSCCFAYSPYNATPPYDDHFVITTMFFRPKRQNTESFNYFEDPVNSNTSLLRPGVYGPMVVAPTGFSCIAFWTFSLPWPWPSLSWHLKLPNNKRLPCSAYPCFPQQMWFLW